MSRLPEAELQQRIQQMRDPKSGAVNALKALDAALATAGMGAGKAQADNFTAAGSKSQTTHVYDTPDEAFMRPHIPEGYAPGEDTGRIASVKAFLETTSKTGLKRAMSLGNSGFIDSLAGGYSEMVADVASKMKDFKKGPKPGEDETSRQMQFEMIKQQMQKISQIETMLTNTLKMMHEQGMQAIRNTRA